MFFILRCPRGISLFHICRNKLGDIETCCALYCVEDLIGGICDLFHQLCGVIAAVHRNAVNIGKRLGDIVRHFGKDGKHHFENRRLAHLFLCECLFLDRLCLGKTLGADTLRLLLHGIFLSLCLCLQSKCLLLCLVACRLGVLLTADKICLRLLFSLIFQGIGFFTDLGIKLLLLKEDLLFGKLSLFLASCDIGIGRCDLDGLSLLLLLDIVSGVCLGAFGIGTAFHIRLLDGKCGILLGDRFFGIDLDGVRLLLCLCLGDSYIALCVCLCDSSGLADLLDIIDTHILDRARVILKVLNIEVYDLNTEFFHIGDDVFGDLFGNTLTVLHHLLKSDRTDDLGAYTLDTQTLYPLEYVGGSVRYYQNGVLQTVPTVTAAGELVISGISVPAEGNTIIIYKTRLTDYAPLGIEASITNTATISGNVTPITASATINMNARAELGISNSVCPTSVTENGRLTYTFVIQNSGSVEATAADSIVLSDLLNPVLTDISAMLNGNALTSPTDYTYDETTGQFASVAGSITVPAATYTQGADGRWTVTPGTSVLTISGKV